MGMQAPSFGDGLRHWSSQNVPAPYRTGAWRHLLGKFLLPASFDPLPDHPCAVEASICVLPGLRIGRGAFGPSITHRTRSIVASDNDDLFLIGIMEGRVAVVQRGREATLEAGQGVLTACDAASVFALPTAGKIFCLRIPRLPLAALVPDIDACVMRPLQGDSAALRFLLDYARPLLRADGAQLADASPALRQLVVAHILDLLALALGPSGEAKEDIAGRGLKAARIAALRRDIAEHLITGDLDVAAVATRNRLSVRHVQRLFEEEGLTFSQFVLDQKLLYARRLLTGPHGAAQKISTLAYASGFCDLSHFNRTFRRKFGATPSELRKRRPE